MKRRKLLIASTSTMFGQHYLEYLGEEIEQFFSGVSPVIFIPFARPGGISFEAYTQLASVFFEARGMNLRGIHEFDNMILAVKKAQGIFIGGGNTFVLLKSIYDLGLLDILRRKLAEGTPYLGTSAGSNILGATIQTTNDMPIVYPPSFRSLGVVPFNINPHYIDPVPGLKHMGEHRDMRIREFLDFNNIPVIALREGSYLKVDGGYMELGGKLSARIFEKNVEPYELNPGKNLSIFLNDKLLK